MGFDLKALVIPSAAAAKNLLSPAASMLETKSRFLASLRNDKRWTELRTCKFVLSPKRIRA